MKDGEADPGILVVDDSSTMRRIISNVLGKLGFHSVEEAGNGQEALEKLDGGRFQLVLLDWNMPILDGLSTLKAIRSRPDTAATPVIMVTTEAEKSRILEAGRAGADGYVLKPFTPHDLGEKIESVLRRAKRA